MAARTTPSADQIVRFDLGLSVAAVRFVSDINRGRVSPKVVHAQLFIPRRTLSAEMAVDSLRDVNRQASVLAGVQPAFIHYQLLKNALTRYRALARDTTLVPLAGLPRVLKPGQHYANAAGLRRLLAATGDVAPGTPSDTSATYSADLVAGVKKFQLRQGYKADGVIGPGTSVRLSRSFEQRVRQIELTLERWRWLPPAFSAAPIIVNIPAFRLYSFLGIADREKDLLAMDVVVGSAYEHHTPVFAAEMKYVIFRPYWEVPVSIMRNELGPKALRDPSVLAREQMVLVDGEGDDAHVLPATRANMERIGHGVRVRQLPGDRNALGAVKFIMPNVNDIYLHDTPSKGLFASARRDFSHGCIRVGDPVALAARVLSDQPEWNPDSIRAAMANGDNHRVQLTHAVPVYIVYATVIARENGDVYFFEDVYGLDRELDALLKKGHPYAN